MSATTTTAACPVCGGELPDDDTRPNAPARVYCGKPCRAQARRRRYTERQPDARIVQPIAGATFRRVAAQAIEGGKRRKLACLVAAYHDADPAYAPTVDEVCARLGIAKRAVLLGLLERLEQDGHIARFRAARGRVTVELALEARRETRAA